MASTSPYFLTDINEAMSELKGLSIHITGIVQGVGFRPFVFGLARRLGLNGQVKNTSSGVEIDLDGTPEALQDFVHALHSEAPSLSHIDSLEIQDRSVFGFNHFEILHSESQEGAFQPISPDVATCPDCLRELSDPADRRYRYPFINCTNCGPRFTIIKDIPYDRPQTTMAEFAMCPDCAEEYHDPANRRFHAQPTACPKCGPRIWLEVSQAGKVKNEHLFALPVFQYTLGNDALLRTRKLLADGHIVAVKGLGGFHLVCNALDPAVVAELRARKLRVDKPFAVMMPDIQTVERHCLVNPEERALLESPARPIVLLRRRLGSNIAPEVAPGQETLGVMLPYTPLHHLLLEKTFDFPEVLVMTSGNLSDEPICTDNIEARTRLKDLAHAFLMHDREIHVRTDDSVIRVIGQLPASSHQPAAAYPVRRSRGYSPFPVHLPWEAAPLLAAGAELKNTFCITHDRYAFLSHHIGDLSNYETLQSFEQGVAHFEKLFRVRPQALACDLHPNYLSTRYAQERAARENLPLIEVQHHHAHIASLMAESRMDGSNKVIGVSFDGTGYGTDGAIWGGEFLLADYAGFERAAHLQYFPLPGGDAATRRPSRTALGLLHALGIEWDDALPTHDDLCYEDRTALRIQLQHKLNAPLTSSMGRLFDAVAALAGVRQVVNYEAQAAIELEALVDPDDTGLYQFDYLSNGIISPAPLVESLVQDVLSGAPAARISSRFHNGLAQMTLHVCRQLADQYDTSDVLLSGGVWQNVTLLGKTVRLLEKEGFMVTLHREVPANDGGLALGQAAVAAWRINHQ